MAEITEIDRDAAWKVRDRDIYGSDCKASWRRGVYDNIRIIQAFANYREMSVAASHAIITKLIGYAGHSNKCNVGKPKRVSDRCTCGYSEAIAEARAFMKGEGDEA